MKKSKDFDIHIFTRNYHSHVNKLEENLYLTNRTHRYHKGFTHVETFGANWVLFLIDLNKSQAKITSNLKSITLSGKLALFIPAFFITEWQIPEGTQHWQCLSSSEVTSYPKDLLVFEWDCRAKLNSHHEIKSFLANSKLIDSITNAEGSCSKVAQSAKKYIQEHYKSDLKMNQLSQALNYHRIYLSREFKKNYHISLVEYRHQLRIYEALKQMNSGKSLTDAIFLSGYSSVNQFIAYFKKYFLTIPSEYNFNKPKKYDIEAGL